MRGLAGLNVGRRLSELGTRWNLPWLVENPLTFRYYHRAALENAAGVVTAFESVFPYAVRYAEIGAGSGAYASEAQRRGHPVTACEYSWIGRSMARVQGVRCEQFDLTQDPPASLGGPSDLQALIETFARANAKAYRLRKNVIVLEAPR